MLQRYHGIDVGTTAVTTLVADELLSIGGLARRTPAASGGLTRTRSSSSTARSPLRTRSLLRSALTSSKAAETP